MIHAFDPRSPGSAVELAAAILKADENSHSLAVQMATAVREAAVAMVVAMALVTHGQNPEKPIVAITEAEANGEECEGHTPGELLLALGESYPEILEEWDALVEVFQERMNKMRTEKAMKQMKDFEMPENLTVDDILKVTKEDGI